MRRFYYTLAYYLKFFHWGRGIVNHISSRPRLYEFVEAGYTALILALLIKSFVFEAYKIPSSSMEDTLQINDRIFVNKFKYMFSDIEVGDIVVFKTEGLSIYDPEKPYYIKRVAGKGGDVLEIKNGYIYRNGKVLDTPEFFLENQYYAYRGKRKFVVPEGELYMFGDNSGNSSDSRDWGGVPEENVMGEAVFRYWPLYQGSLLTFWEGVEIDSRFGLIKGVPPETARKLAKHRRRIEPSPGSAEAADLSE